MPVQNKTKQKQKPTRKNKHKNQQGKINTKWYVYNFIVPKIQNFVIITIH